MRGRTTRLSALVAVAALAVVGVSAATAGTGQRFANETPKLWFVEYPSAPLADGNTDAAVAGDDSAFRAEARSRGISFKERHRFNSLWNGISVEAKPSAIAKIREFASVKAVYPVGIHRVPETARVSPDLATALAMTGADVAQSELGLTGKGVRVAVMDTGIDYDHPDLGGGFGKGKRVVTGWDFVGDDYNADPTSAGYQPVPHPDPDPDDCNGHGTHVAGIIGAKGAVTGVAPGVTFGAYRVFGCDGSVTDDVMLAAMERILKDRMDVLNMSIGDAFNNWPGTPTAEASTRLVKKGIVVVASIGNSGADGMYAAGAPGVGEGVIGTASFDNTHIALSTFTVSPDGTSIGYANATAAPEAPTSGSLPMARTGTTTTTNDGCTALPAGSLTGMAVLIRRGTCTFHVKAANAQAAGAAAVVLYNNAAGRFSPTVAGAVPITIPVVAVSNTEGALINGRLAGGPVTMTWTNRSGTFLNSTGNLISSFSSYGLAADLTLKPDIGAPGGFIRSTYPLEEGGYATLSGTSMASPHVAGAVALLLESRASLRRGGDDDWRSTRRDDENFGRAGLIRDILQNSAVPKDWWGAPGSGYLDNVQRQGAGMLQIDAAVQASSLVLPGKLSLGENETMSPITKRLSISNNSRSTLTYTFSHAPALANGARIYSPNFFDEYATVSFSSSSVTVGRGDSRSVNVTITPPADLPDRGIYGGYVVIAASDGQTFRVPYVGLKGDYQSIKILNGAIALGGPDAVLVDGSLDDPPTSGVFTLQGASVPTVAWHADLQAREVTLQVVDAANRVLGRAFDVEYFPRNQTAGGVFAVSWDGTYQPGNRGQSVRTAPDGTYRLILTAEKPLADRKNPAHVETWTSPSFTIDRP